MYTVFIEELDLYAYHGVPDEEQIIGHRYRLNIKLQVEGTADFTDRVDDTVDYGSIAQYLDAQTTSRQFRTVERLAAHLAESVLGKFPLVQQVRLTVRKPLPPAPIIAANVGVTVERTRSHHEP